MIFINGLIQQSLKHEATRSDSRSKRVDQAKEQMLHLTKDKTLCKSSILYDK